MYVVHHAFDIHNAPRRCKSRKSSSSFSPLLSARLFTCLYERFFLLSLSRALPPLLRLIMTMMMLSFFYRLSFSPPPPFPFLFYFLFSPLDSCPRVMSFGMSNFPPPVGSNESLERDYGWVTQGVHFAHIQVWTETQSQHEGIAQVKGPVSHATPPPRKKRKKMRRSLGQVGVFSLLPTHYFQFQQLFDTTLRDPACF